MLLLRLTNRLGEPNMEARMSISQQQLLDTARKAAVTRRAQSGLTRRVSVARRASFAYPPYSSHNMKHGAVLRPAHVNVAATTGARGAGATGRRGVTAAASPNHHRLT